jgi:hypothetical protein
MNLLVDMQKMLYEFANGIEPCMRFGAFRFQIQEDDEGEAGVSAHLSSSIVPRPTSTVWCCLVLLSLGDLSLQQFGVALPW